MTNAIYTTQFHTSFQHLRLTPPHYRYVQHSVTQIPPTTTPHSTSLPLCTALSYTNPTNTYASLHLTTSMYSSQLHNSHQHLRLTPPHYRYIQLSVTQIPPTPTPHSTSLPLCTALSYTIPTNTYASLHLTTAIYSTQLQKSHQHLRLTPPHYRYVQHSVTQIPPTPTPHSTSLPLYTALSYTLPTNTYTSHNLTVAIFITQLRTSQQHLHLTPPHYSYILH